MTPSSKKKNRNKETHALVITLIKIIEYCN